jgi:3',5'-cyclic AMP phosphodiesterase CpdA
MIHKIKRTRFCQGIINGDLVENNTRSSVGEGVYEQILTPEEQVEVVIDDIEPLADKDKLLGISRGNHEKRTSNNDGIDIVNSICRELDIPRLMSHSLHTFHFDDVDKEYTLMCTYGKSGGQTKGGKMNAVEKLVHMYQADAYLYGHVHDLFQWKHIIMGPYDDYYRRFAINGSFMAYIDSYAQEGEYRPGIPGYMSTMVGRDGIEFVENEINWPEWPIVEMNR